MSRAVAYIVNEHPFYIRMLFNSIAMVLNNTPSPPAIYVFLIKDDKKLTIRRGGSFDGSSDSEGVWIEQLRAGQKSGGYKLIEKTPWKSDDEDFFHVNRSYLGELGEDSLLYIDVDTFVFGDINLVFDRHEDKQFVAAPAEWVQGREFPGEAFARLQMPFSSGVMLFNGESHVQWAQSLPGLCRMLRERRHPVSEWLYKQHSDCLLREEFAASAWVDGSGVEFGYFSPEDVTLIRYPSDFDKLGKQIVFHSYTPNWKECWRRICKRQRRTLVPRYYPKAKKDA